MNTKTKLTAISLAGFFLISTTVKAELPKELSLKTESGEVVLTIESCPITASPYEYKAYATERVTGEGVKVHKGCWTKSGPQVSILFYEEPQQPFIATYADYYFKPRPNM